MRAQLDETLQDILGTDELIIITEGVDDIVLLIGQMEKMGLVEILNKHLPKHWKQRDLSWGWTAVIWLAYISRYGDHRKVSMENYIKGMLNTLRSVTGQQIEPLDFSDDRLTRLLKSLSNPKYWPKIEKELNNKTIEVYKLPTELVRCDATSVSGYHQINEEGIIQFGHSKDDPTLPQLKVMAGALDPLGLPLVTSVVSGEQADFGLYIPIIKQIDDSLNQTGLLYVGDSKMSALEIREHIIRKNNHYFSPLPLTGHTATDMESWITEGIKKDYDYELDFIFRKNNKGEEVLVAAGYEFERELSGYSLEKEELKWTERVLVIKSFQHAERQVKGLEKRLETAINKIEALTPARGRGKRQIIEETQLLEAIKTITTKHKVNGLITVEYEKQTEPNIRYIGPGRGSKNRESEITEKVRYQITSVVKNQEQIAVSKERFGWKAFVTSAVKNSLSLPEAILNYRNEYRIERIFNRLKNRLNIAPLFVKRDDQITGLTHLLSLGVRVLTLLEFVVRRSLENDQSKLTGLHPENHQKSTDKPTAERILKAFSNLSLTIIKTVAGELRRYLTPLSELQKEILNRLGLDLSLYLQLEILNSQNLLSEW